MRGLVPDKMSIKQLQEIVSIMSKRGGSKEPPRLATWSKTRCVKWLNDNNAALNSIGNFCRNLLRVVVGKTNDGYTIGLSYIKIVSLIQVYYPCSMADEKHLRWYATSMRAAGEMIPVYRERSKWR